MRMHAGTAVSLVAAAVVVSLLLSSLLPSVAAATAAGVVLVAVTTALALREREAERARRAAIAERERALGEIADLRSRLQLARSALSALDEGVAVYGVDDALLLATERYGSVYDLPDTVLAPGTSRSVIQREVGRGPERAGPPAAGSGTERVRSRWVHTAVRTVDGGGSAVVGRDVTAVRQLEDDLRRARDLADAAARAKTDFLATMSHEVRTPLNAVIAMSGLLAEECATAEQLEYVRSIQEAGQSLLAMFNEILDYAKLDAGSLALAPRSFSPRQLLDGVAEHFAETAARKRIGLEAAMEGEVPARVVADEGRLRQVLHKLVANAIKFTEPGGQVRVTVAVMARGARGVILRLSVKDTGIGIPPELRARLFEPFSQADSSTTRRYGGTGLGLALSRRLLVAMGGSIELAGSTSAGTEFRCTLPVDVDTTAPGSETADAPTESGPAPSSAVSWPGTPSAGSSAAAPAGPGGDDALDEQTLAVIREMDATGSAGLLADIVGSFLETIPPQVDELQAAASAGDLAAVARVAHALRGGCGVVGARRVVAAAAELERQAKTGEAAGIVEKAAALAREMEVVRPRLAALVVPPS